MSYSLETEIAALPTLNRAQLQQKWRSALKYPAPPHLRKQMLVPLLAYKMQEQVYGGLKPETKRRLRKLAKSFEAERKSGVKQPGTMTMKPGTRLLRQWQGETHHVTVCEEGFEYRGEPYKTLSQIARLISGTRWSGPLFFGLKQGHNLRSRS